MPIPKAIFSYVPDGLSVTFRDASTNAPTSWAWDFGDTSTNTVASPSYTYAAAGHYDVTLVATNADGSSEAAVLTIGVADNGVSVLNEPLVVYVEKNVPTTVDIPLNNKVSLIRKHQEWISILVPRTIADANVFDEYYYTALENELVSYLVVLDLILEGANKWLLANQGDDSTVSGQQLKKIATGPSEAEYFQQSEDWFNIMKPGGLYEQLQARACNLAARLRIHLPFCPALAQSPIVPQKKTIDYGIEDVDDDKLGGNPWGYPSEMIP